MRLLLPFLLVMALSSCWMLRAYRIRHMNLQDHQKLPSVVVHKGDSVFRFIDGAQSSSYRELKTFLDSELPRTQTAAFLVIRNDSIIYEAYFGGFTANDILPSNSMAKSFTGTLVGIALAEGSIRSLSEPMTNYIPELLKKDPNFKKITIQHLLDMNSGFDFSEGSYDLKDDAIRLGLRPNVKKQLLKIKIAQPPGRFRYQSINTQFLGWILERATGKKLSAYLEEKLWKPLGAEQNATWNVDSKKRKREYASAGLNATARDFAKLGQLYVNKGRWGTKQILDSSWINQLAIDSMHKFGGYKNQWWNRTVYRSFEDSAEAVAFHNQTAYATGIRRSGNGFRVSYRTPAFSAIGFLNQFIYVHPQKKLIIVRVGRRWTYSGSFATQFIYQLGESL